MGNHVTMKIAVLDDYQDATATFGDWASLPDCELHVFPDHVTGAAVIERLRGFDVVVAMRERTPLDRETIAALPDLKLIVTSGAMNAVIDVAAATEHGVVVCGTGGIVTNTAELAWGLILALQRHIPAEDASIRAGGWQHTMGRDLAGQTLGLLGLGRIGAMVAKVGAAFGMNIIAWSQNLTAEVAAERGGTLVSKEELFANADVLSIHLVLSDRTRALVGAAELALMKPTAVLINVSRGPIVDEAALVEALQEQRIGGAGIDVFEFEPLAADHPFRRLPNTVITPHIGYVTEDCYRMFFDEIVEDIRAWIAGEPIRVIG
jgi:phosphoglycerate dehydrogenase-like enzyme